MDFELTDEQIMSRDMARKFAEQEILPTLKENERQEKFDPGIIKKMASQGLLAPHIPEEYGGMGLVIMLHQPLSGSSSAGLA